MTDRASIITKAVAEECGLSLAQINLVTHQRQFSRPRQIAMTLQRKIMGERAAGSLPAIARRFAGCGEHGRMHHTTVLWAMRRVDQLRTKDRGFDELYQRCEARAQRDLLDAQARDEAAAAKVAAKLAREKRVAEYFEAAVEPLTRPRLQVSSGRSAA